MEDKIIAKDLQLVLDNYPGIFEILDDRNKLLCKLTKHELPLSIKAVQSHVQGRKFKRFYEKVKTPAKVFKLDDEYKEFFVPSRKNKSRLYCKLTRKEINNLPHEIEQHITGYRFLKAKFIKKEEDEKAKQEGESVIELSEQEIEDEDEDEDMITDENFVDDTPDYAKSSEDDDEEENVQKTDNISDENDVDEDEIVKDTIKVEQIVIESIVKDNGEKHPGKKTKKRKSIPDDESNTKTKKLTKKKKKKAKIVV